MGMNMEEKIRYILKDFKEIDDYEKSWFWVYRNYSTWNYSPPAYVLKKIFIDVLWFKNLWINEEKVTWKINFEYMWEKICLRDYKFWTRTIEVSNFWEDSKEFDTKDILRKGILDEKIAKKLNSALQKASLEVDKLIKEEAEDLIVNENCWLNNTYNDTVSTYWFYKDKLENVVKEIPQEKIENKVDLVNLKMNYEYIRRQYLFWFIASFFSRLESVISFLFCFMKSEWELYREFMNKDFKERFKTVFKSSFSDPIFKPIYDWILQRYWVRNWLIHGLVNNDTFLIYQKWIGLVPSRYSYLTEKIEFDFWLTNENVDIDWTIGIFDKFRNHLENNTPYNVYLIYITAQELQIPLEFKEMEKLKKELTSDTKEAKKLVKYKQHRFHEWNNREY